MQNLSGGGAAPTNVEHLQTIPRSQQSCQWNCCQSFSTELLTCIAQIAHLFCQNPPWLVLLEPNSLSFQVSRWCLKGSFFVSYQAITFGYLLRFQLEIDINKQLATPQALTITNIEAQTPSKANHKRQYLSFSTYASTEYSSTVN